jgi:hypothetical protein
MAVKERTKKVARCLTCSNKAKNRGLCERCDKAAKAAIIRGQVTEQELIDQGLILAPKRKGRPAQSGFAKALAKVKARDS